MDRSYFDDVYSTSLDPWGFDDTWYERRKYDLTMAMLPNARYRRALESGSSGGTFTQRIAQRCDELISFDFVGIIVERARSRVGHLDNVEVRVAEFPT